MSATRFFASMIMNALTIYAQSFEQGKFDAANKEWEGKEVGPDGAAKAPQKADFYRLKLEDACKIAATIYEEPCMGLMIYLVIRSDEKKITEWAEVHSKEEELPDELKMLLAIVSGIGSLRRQ